MSDKACRTCGETHPEDSYYIGNRNTGSRVLDCRRCHSAKSVARRKAKYTAEELREAGRRYNAARPIESKRAHSIKSRYGISPDDFVALLDAQGHACAICARLFSELDETKRKGRRIDHDHATGRVRGLLCDECNRGLGTFYDDPKLLRLAAEYVEANGVAMAHQHPEWQAREFLNRGNTRAAKRETA